jgi:chromate transporter
LKTKEIRYLIFLKDVLVLSLTSIGGPQAHLALFLEKLVKNRRYLSEHELLELQSLCQVLPGPTSTQVITALGYRIGGPTLAYFTLFFWILPATVFMGLTALGISFINNDMLIRLSIFIKPIGVAFILFAAFLIGRKVIVTKTAFWLMATSAVLGYLFRSPYLAPALILIGGLISSAKYRKQQKMEKKPIKIRWGNLILWAVIFIGTAVAGGITKSLPVRLFENFYRNGSIAFGGGHILKPLLFNEFVEFKHYLTPDEFLSGIAIAEIIPGPTFSISSYVGSLSMRDWGYSGQILGSVVASVGIFLPGILMIFFVIKFWDQLKQFRGIRASLEGINAASTGLTLAAGISLTQPLLGNYLNVVTIFLSLLFLIWGKLPAYLLILVGLGLGYIF